MVLVQGVGLITAMLAVAGVSAGYLIRSIRIGHIRGRFLTYDRATHPFEFWVSALMYFTLAWLACVVAVTTYLSM